MGVGARLGCNFLYDQLAASFLHEDVVGEDEAAAERARVARVLGEVDSFLEDDVEVVPAGPSVDRTLRLVGSGADVIGFDAAKAVT